VGPSASTLRIAPLSPLYLVSPKGMRSHVRMRLHDAVSFAHRWIQLQKAACAASICEELADGFEQVIVERGRYELIASRPDVLRYWSGVIARRRERLALHHLVFDCAEARLAIVYMPSPTLAMPDEADLLELDQNGKAKRAEVLLGGQVVDRGLAAETVVG